MAKKAVLQKKSVAPFSFDDVHKLIDIIEQSEIPTEDKVFYLLAIVDGCFTLELFEELMGKVKTARDGIAAEIDTLDKEMAQLKKEIDEGKEKIGESVIGAAGEIKDAINHVEHKAFKEVERIKHESAQQKIANIKKTLKKNAK